MNETGKSTKIAAEMTRDNLSILGLREARWIETGCIRLSTVSWTDLFSNHDDSNVPHTEGVGLMLTPQAGKSLIGWTLSVRFQPMSDLSTYGCQHELSNETDDEAKSDFYARLQRFIDGETRKDLILYLSLGVFNS